MSEREYISGYLGTIFDACDGDHPDNFARSITAEDMIYLYLISGDEEVD